MSSEPSPLRVERLRRLKNRRGGRNCRVKLLYVASLAVALGGAAVFWTFRPKASFAAVSPSAASSAAAPKTPTPALAANEVLREALELRGGRLHRVDTGAVFTGTLVERYSTTAIRARIEIRDGLADGLSLGWYDTGQAEVRESFVAGRSHGLRTRWYKNGVRRSEAEIQDGRLQGVYREWHDNGTLAVEMTLVADRPAGVVRRWSADGRSLPDYHPAQGPALATAP